MECVLLQHTVYFAAVVFTVPNTCFRNIVYTIQVICPFIVVCLMIYILIKYLDCALDRYHTWCMLIVLYLVIRNAECLGLKFCTLRVNCEVLVFVPLVCTVQVWCFVPSVCMLQVFIFVPGVCTPGVFFCTWSVYYAGLILCTQLVCVLHTAISRPGGYNTAWAWAWIIFL